jgi:uncharacterized protein (DUF2252 family)
VKPDRALLVTLLAACANAPDSDRQQRIVTSLADDNWLTAIRDPDLVRLKLIKMQRGPYEWLRGTASLFWRDVMEPGAARPISTGDEASSHVLLVGDPHVENVGTFRASDGTMFVDWNDFDATGYGPFTGDLRRLGASLAIAAPSLAEPLIRRAMTSYAQTMAQLAAGTRLSPILRGRSPLLDNELDKARTRGESLFAIDELAPVTDGARVLALGDLEPVAADGVIEDRVIAISAEHAAWIDRAVSQWRASRSDADALGAIKLRARRIGSGVSSYAVYRWNVVLEGATPSPDDDRVIELKETREGVIVEGLPHLTAAEWDSPASRAVDSQHRLQARGDGDGLLGSALVGGLSIKIRDREAFQRGIDHADITALAGGDSALELAGIYGELLARAHGLARTEDGALGSGQLGVDVIAPLVNEATFVDEMTQISIDDAAVIAADHALMKDHDLFAEVMP